MNTLLIIKPNAVKKHVVGEIVKVVEAAEFEILALKSFIMNDDLANDFYAEHKGKDFFTDLKNFMSSGLSIAFILEKDNAVEKLRELIGNTDPKKAAVGTIRHLYGDSVRQNAVHASDSEKSSKREINIIFGKEFK